MKMTPFGLTGVYWQKNEDSDSLVCITMVDWQWWNNLVVGIDRRPILHLCLLNGVMMYQAAKNLK
jgi:hypothetical protein